MGLMPLNPRLFPNSYNRHHRDTRPKQRMPTIVLATFSKLFFAKIKNIFSLRYRKILQPTLLLFRCRLIINVRAPWYDVNETITENVSITQ